MKNFSSIVLIAIFVLLPNLFCNQLIEPENSLKLLVLSSILAVYLLFTIFKKNSLQVIRIPFGFTFLLCFILLKFTGIFFSYNKSEAIFDSLLWLVSTLVSILVLNDFINKEITIQKISMLAACASICFTGWGIYSAMSQINLLIKNHRPIHVDYLICSSLGNKNFYTQVCFLLLPFLVIGIKKLDLISKIFVAFAIVLNVASIIVLKSFAVYIASAITILIVLYYLMRNKKPLLFFSTIIISVLCFIFFSLNLKTQFLSNRIAEFSNAKSVPDNINSSAERVMLWQTSWKIIKENPFGIGTCNWAIYFLKFSPDCSLINNYGEMKYKRPHNDFLLIFSENGWLGLFVFLIFFAILFYQCLCIPKRDLIKYSLLTSLTGFFIFCLFDFPMQRYYGLQLLFIAIALISFFSIRQKHIFSKCISIPKKSFLIVAILIAISSTCISAMRLQGEFMLYKTIENRLQGDWWQMNESGKASSGVYYTHDPVGQPINWYRGIALLNQNKTYEAKCYFYKSLEQNPFHFESWNDLGSCYERLGNNDSAIICFRRNLKFAPHHPNSSFNMAVMMFDKIQYDSAQFFLRNYPYKNFPEYLAFTKQLNDSLHHSNISKK